ncbi:MAG: 3-dehydroquinate synthase [Spirochaetaceae bacterium]|jgi:3-dehydroquinate synthase|nr:3-dehydroquinate synthase [Spirochaetaceae bacterium]
MRVDFIFNSRPSSAFIQQNFPLPDEVLREYGAAPKNVIVVCDSNTRVYAGPFEKAGCNLCVIGAGEDEKNWDSVNLILQRAFASGLGRDSLFLGVGGGVITDLTSFAASIYMRSVNLALISTTLLGMTDAALGGKTGIDVFGVKNLAGTFYGARFIWTPLDALKTLPAREWKSGFAEIIKTAILDETKAFTDADADAEADGWIKDFYALKPFFDANDFKCVDGRGLKKIVSAAIEVKGRIVEADPLEKGVLRAKLNLGHTFGHALESAAGLGGLSHGEAVAWGVAKACELGARLKITPPARAAVITGLLKDLGYETGSPHPRLKDERAFITALMGDKKKKNGCLRFITPGEKGAQIVDVHDEGLGEIKKITGI